MSLTFYGGVMGSGKSYEVVSGPVCDAVAAGRRVVTNVAGINEERIHEYLLQKRPGLDAAKLGTVVHVTDERVMEPGFFPDEKKPEIDSVVKGGDLVAIDEAWRFWDQDKGKLPAEHMQFFRMHRHYVDPATGVTCDVVMMSQDIGGLSRSLKPVVELSFRMHKLKSIGVQTGYRVEMYEGHKQTKATRVSTFVKKYQKDVFPLYKSYDGENAKELRVDKRQNVLADKRLWVGAAFLVVMCFVSVRFLWSFFHRAAHGATTVAAASLAASSVHVGAAGAAAAVGPSTGSPKPVLSENWRIVGTYSGPGRAWVVIADSSGRLRIESPSMFQNTGVVRVGMIDGEQVSTFSGTKPVAGSGAGSVGLGGASK